MFVLLDIFGTDLEPYDDSEYGSSLCIINQDEYPNNYFWHHRSFVTFDKYEDAVKEIERRNARNGKGLGVELKESDIPELRRQLGLPSYEELNKRSSVYSFHVSAF